MGIDYSKMVLKNKDVKNEWFDKKIRPLKNLCFEPGTNGTSSRNNDFLVKLSSKNAKIIEKEIGKSDNYNPDYSIDTIVFNHFGGAEYFSEGKAKKEEIRAVLRCIDVVNSTQAWRNPDGFNAIIDFIMEPLEPKKPEEWFWNRVKEYDENLVDDIVKKTKKNSKWSKGLISFASKVCRFFNMNVFLRDDYYVWDSVVLDHLKYYWYFYVKSPKFIKPKKYSKIYDALETIRKNSCKRLGRIELDHIIWYCYRVGK